jgi:hypothetical protein
MADRLLRFEQEARVAAALNHPNILDAVFQMGNACRFPKRCRPGPVAALMNAALLNS